MSRLAEEKGWLDEEQAAFREGRGVEDHLFVLETIKETAKITGASVLFAFLDLKKAYDSVDRRRLWEFLRELGLDEKTVDILQGEAQK